MLADRYRPQSWAEVVGNDKAIEKIAALATQAREARDSLVLLLTGPAGVGKSTVARLVAKSLGADECHVEHIPSGKCTAERVREVEDTLGHSALFGSGWRVIVVEEVDKIAPQAQSLWLTLLETMPHRCAVIFTSNTRH
ncbi:MAG: AAA family ATPase, partial [Planctomycetes bacterium]|nr:AAA family ATPase [Planctomycetota bacterium]